MLDSVTAPSTLKQNVDLIGELWTCFNNTDGTWEWASLGAPGSQIVASMGTLMVGGQSNVFGLDTTGQLWTCFNNTDSNWEWANLGTPGLPITLSMGTLMVGGQSNVFGLDTTGQLWTCFNNTDGNWEWANLGTSSSPIIFSMGTLMTGGQSNIFTMSDPNANTSEKHLAAGLSLAVHKSTEAINLPAASLICQFTLVTSDPELEINVSFQNDGESGNYGGWILVPTDWGPDLLTTGLWDSDGNVYFTLYENDNPSRATVVINSASVPGSFNPYITAQNASGLSCQIVLTGNDPTTNTYNYNLVVNAASPPAPAASPLVVQADTAPAPADNPSPVTYQCSIGLFQNTPSGPPLSVWQPGTMELTLNPDGTMIGSLSIPGYYSETVLLAGQISTATIAGIPIVASGKTSQIQVNLQLSILNDGFLYNGSYLGGTVSILDNNAEETYAYVLAGSSDSYIPVAKALSQSQSS